jgi:hypothetical protein
MNEGDRILMTEIMAQLKVATGDRDKAQEQMNLWIKRMDLAKQARDRDLWEAARQKAVEAEDKKRDAEKVIMELEVERDNLRRKARAPKADPGLAHANHLMEQFKALGVDPEDAKFEKLEKEAGAQDALEALKRRMEQDS